MTKGHMNSDHSNLRQPAAQPSQGRQSQGIRLFLRKPLSLSRYWAKGIRLIAQPYLFIATTTSPTEGHLINIVI